MDAFKFAILCACTVTVIGKMITYLCSDRYNNILRLMTALVLILTVSKAFTGDTPDISLPDLSDELIDHENETKDQYLDSVSNNMTKKLSEIYKNKDIDIQRISIACSYDEYKYITVDRIIVYPGDNTDHKTIESIAKEYFPDTEISVSG